MNLDELDAAQAPASWAPLSSNHTGSPVLSQGPNGKSRRESTSLFPSFFLAGFECSSHRLCSGPRLDLIASTRHDEFCHQDYQRLIQMGIQTVREGLRWHLIETERERYDFASVEPMVTAANANGLQVIWDIFHYGFPDDIELFSTEFRKRFVRFAAASAQWLAERTAGPLFLAPINEISFFSWAAGDSGYLTPRYFNRGFELKTHLSRCAIESIDAIRAVASDVRFVHIDPIINVVAHPNRRGDRGAAQSHTQSQYQVWDMMDGRLWPHLGGEPDHLDIIGVNFYPDNQWIHGVEIIRRSHPLYRPFRHMLKDMYERYQRPILIAETGCEDEERPAWLRYVCEEAKAAMEMGVRLEGICLYPIVNHPGWDNNRHCHNGLWDYADDEGNRRIFQPLADELLRWRKVFEPDEETPRPITRRGSRSVERDDQTLPSL